MSRHGRTAPRSPRHAGGTIPESPTRGAFLAVRKKVVRMKVIHSSRPCIVSGSRRTVGPERRRPSELYPLGIEEVTVRGKD